MAQRVRLIRADGSEHEIEVEHLGDEIVHNGVTYLATGGHEHHGAGGAPRVYTEVPESIQPE